MATSIDRITQYIMREHNISDRRVAEQMAREGERRVAEQQRYAQRREEALNTPYHDWLKREFPEMDWDSPIYVKIIEHVQAVLDGEITQLIINVPPRVGKCLKTGTLVQMADGTRKPIEQIYPSDLVISIDSCYNATVGTVSSVVSNGVKKLLRLSLDSGQSFTCTENHPLLSVLGWKEASEYKEGDRIAAIKKLPPSNAERLPKGIPSILGYIVGDGSFSSRFSGPSVTTIDPAVIIHLHEIASDLGWEVKKSGKYAYRIINRRENKNAYGRKDLSCPGNVLGKLMERGTSYTKRVPNCIINGCNEDITLFLAAYFNCDGHIQFSEKQNRMAEFYSVNKNLLLDTQYLLRKLGIYSRIRQKRGRYKGETHLSWRLYFDGKDLIEFSRQVPVVGEKGEKTRAAAADIADKRHLPQYESIPPEWKKLMTNVNVNGRVNYGHGLRRLHGIRVDKNYKCGTAREVVMRVAEVENNDRLREVCNDSIIWESIDKIEVVEEGETWDIEVGGTHNFVIENGVVVHNSALVTIRLPVFWLLRYPTNKVIIGAYNKDLAKNFSEESLKIYQDITPLTVESSLADEWSTVYGGMVKAIGVGSSVAGFGADLLLADDPIKSYAEAHSPTYQTMVWNWWLNDLRTRRNRLSQTPTILIHTRWTEEDLTGRILSSATASQWTVLTIPAISIEDDPQKDALGRHKGESILPSRLPIQDLITIENEMGRDFQGLYQQNPKSEASYTIKTQRIEVVEEVPVGADRVRYFDRAGSEGKGDWTVGVLMAIDDNGFVYIEDVLRGQWAPEDVERQIEQTIKLDAYKYAGKSRRMMQFWIEQEPAASGKQVAYATQRKLAGYEVMIDRPGDNKDVRSRPFSAYVNAGNVRMKRAEWNAAYIKELSLYIAFGKREHDDQVDASSGAYTKLTIERMVVESR
jgi:predicted phage terminase large subunit-like protein